MKNNKEYLDKLRHSVAHLLAAAIIDLCPKTKLAIGPTIENGFYYDFEFDKQEVYKVFHDPKDENNKQPLSERIGTLNNYAFEKIEKKMHQIVKSWNKFEQIEVTSNEAMKQFNNNLYKQELIKEFVKEGKKLTLYKSGSFIDLCRGGHIDHPSNELKHFKLLSIAGAYWRGSEKNKMLTRIYGTAFPTKKELDQYLWQLEEVKSRDHRKIGAQLDLWTFSDLVGSGLPLFTQKGALLRRLISEFVEELQIQQGIEQVWTPQIAKAELFKTSGHYDKYRENMMSVKSNYSDEEFFLKPMNCPQHTQIYASKQRAYRDLPIRLSDFAMLYRDEKPGELLGLARTRSFSQDDCHIFCREDQIEAEMSNAIEMTKKIMNTYGFSYKYRLSTRDPNNLDKYLGDPKLWNKAEKLSKKILEDHKLDYFPGPGEAAFYAPKLDLTATDSLGREWQLSTLQIDYVQPSRFNLSYINDKGQKETPVMLHRAISGSPERLMAILIEHYAGAFPVWLSPIQAKILPISGKNIKYASDLFENLRNEKIRVELDNRNETLQAKIRDSQLEKVPYMIIIGDREEKSNKISLRLRSDQDLGQMKLTSFLKRIKVIIENRFLKL